MENFQVKFSKVMASKRSAGW